MSAGAGVNYGFTTASQGILQNNVTNQPEVQRTPTTFKRAASLTGNTVIWNPAGKKYRLMGGIIVLSKNATCAGAFYINLADSVAGPLVYFDISSAALAAIGSVTVIPFTIPNDGFLSPTAGNTLIFQSPALTAGFASANVWGTEE